MKNYGIIIAYNFNVDLRSHGLGRYLAQFLKGAEKFDDIKLTLVCPNWSRKMIYDLCASEQIDINRISLVTSEARPIIFRIYNKLYSKNIKSIKLVQTSLISRLELCARKVFTFLIKKIVTQYKVPNFFLLLMVIVILGASNLLLLLLLSPIFLLWMNVIMAMNKLSYLVRFAKLNNYIKYLRAKIKLILFYPNESCFVADLHEFIREKEMENLIKIINNLNHISGWYCPTAFWPEVNKINSPVLLCVPDIVLERFPINFACSSGKELMKVYKSIQDTVSNAKYFVTYSEDVKQKTLVERYSISSERIFVVPHAPQDLSSLINVEGFYDCKAAIKNYAESLFYQALQKSFNRNYTLNLENNSIEFIFYASQFRPHKNVVNLLKAYNYLLRKRFISSKLILTGHPANNKDIMEYIINNNLENDVLCLHGLTLSELAACYYLAKLAVNPSLSEGGCPFTFTEALSVNTPVVMAKIPVSVEIFKGSFFINSMFFDPYDWKDMADTIENGIINRDELLKAQKPIYDRLSKRKWDDVVIEHIKILDTISKN